MKQKHPDQPAQLLTAAACALALLAATAVQAQVGVLQGVVSGVAAGTVLPVFKGDTKVADITVGADGKFSVPLGTGVYTVKCPNGSEAKVAALNGASTASINCK